MNIHGQSGLPITKQKQIEDFIRRNSIDILNCQEINIEEDTFSQCSFLSSNFTTISNNAQNKYGTASLIKNDFNAENITMDKEGRIIIFEVGGITCGNLYLQSGTDAFFKGKKRALLL